MSDRTRATIRAEKLACSMSRLSLEAFALEWVDYGNSMVTTLSGTFHELPDSSIWLPHIFSWCSIVERFQVTRPVHTQVRTRSSYLYQENLPAMTENTICFWFRGDDDVGENMHETFLSIATPGMVCTSRSSS